MSQHLLNDGLETGRHRRVGAARMAASCVPPRETPERLEADGRNGTAKLDALLRVIADLLFRVNRDGVVLEFTSSIENHLSAHAGSVVGKNFLGLLPPQIAHHAIHAVEEALCTGTTQSFGCHHLVLGNPCDFEVRVVKCHQDEVLALVRDVSDRKLLEREILEISNREQQRIGQDLHDSLGQHLTGISFLSKVLQRKLAAQALPEADDAGEISRLVIQALAQTRNLARGLFPAELESQGLVAALRELVGNAEKLFGIQCALECDDTLLIQDPTLSSHLFRIAQEAINNSMKHGKAKAVAISLTRAGERITLLVRDNGVGLPPEAKRCRGLGLRIMQYRAYKIGATLQVAALEDGGTAVTCVFRNPAATQAF
ncbi:MAG TPA: ATP-binding protein [Verrucomicrobiae bacterium]